MAKNRRIGNFIAGFILVGGLLCNVSAVAGNIVVENELSDAKYFYNEYETDLTEVRSTLLDADFYNKKAQELANLEAERENMDVMEHAAKKAYLTSDSYAYDYIKAENEEYFNENVKPLIDGSIRNYKKIEELNKKEDALSAVAAAGVTVAIAGAATFMSSKEREC